jgi:GT2 family glycosyltransferase
MSNSASTLAWTGERMIPFVSDYATQATHWQRYLFFRPWYEEATIIDAACGEGYGTDYASVFAKEATGVDISEEATTHAKTLYTHANFVTDDVCNHDYSKADLVVSYETIEHLPDPEKFLKAVSACQGRIIISTPNRSLYDPHAKLGDKPSNPYHTIEWSAEEYAKLIKSHFPDRQVRFLSQSPTLPGRLYEGLDPQGWFIIAVIGDGDLPQWPKIGMSMPTVDNSVQGIESVSAFATYYPGEIEFAVVLNGTTDEHKQNWRTFAAQTGSLVTLIESETNLGYGRGANLGLDYLQNNGTYGVYGVTNDDVYPSLGCMTEMAFAYNNLKEMGQKPGILGVTSNRVNGQQQREIGEYNDLASMMRTANNYLREHKTSATPWPQIRGLCILVSPECLDMIGGFDPIFGLGNFEDDDYSLRARLAGFTTWIVDGAWLFHEGSQTFSQLNVNYQANIERNMEIFCRKWKLHNHAQFIEVEENVHGIELYTALDAFHPIRTAIDVGEEKVDLITQTTDVDFAYWVYTMVKLGNIESREVVFNALSEFVSRKLAEQEQRSELAA